MRRSTVAVAFVVVAVAAVATLFGLWSGPVPEAPTPAPTATIDGIDPGAVTVGYTHQRPTGNRVADGAAAMPDAEPWEIGLPGRPRWVVGAADGDATVWTVVLDSGRVRGYRIGDAGVTTVPVTPSRVDPASPPALALVDDGPRLLVAPDAARYGHPVVADDAVAWVDASGDLVVRRGGEERRVALDALPDARLAVRDGVAAVLVGPTRRYRHGVLGDDVEASAVALVDLANASVTRRLEPSDDRVVEGLQPVLADVGDGDAAWEVLVTASEAGDGARLVALDRDGDVVATGPGFGAGNRWRHQIAVTDHDGEHGPVAVETPHIGGTGRFHVVSDGRFEVTAAADDVALSSHVLGSRNLDAAIAGDLDGDGAAEVLAPSDDRRALVAVAHGDGGGEDWRVDAGAPVATNLAAATVENRTTVAVGTADGIRIWRPGE